MSQKLALTAVVAVAGAVAGVVLVAAVRPAPEHVSSGPAVARRAEEAPTGAQTPAQAALKPRKGRVLSVADAAKELDLIAPSRQKLAEDFTLPLVGGDKLRLFAARGKVVYAAACAGCHGADGKLGQSGGAIADASYLSLVSDQYLRTTVIAGRVDLGMPDWRNYTPGQPLTTGQISDVVAWLIAQRRPIPGRPHSAKEG